MKNLKLAIASSVLCLLASCATAPEPAPQPQPVPLSLPAPPPARREVAPPPQPQPAPAPVAARCDAAVTFQNEEVFAFTKSELTQAAIARLDRDAVIVEHRSRGLDRDHPARADEEVDGLHSFKKNPALERGSSLHPIRIIFPDP